MNKEKNTPGFIQKVGGGVLLKNAKNVSLPFVLGVTDKKLKTSGNRETQSFLTSP